MIKLIMTPILTLIMAPLSLEGFAPEKQIRLMHANELLGRHFVKSQASASYQPSEVLSFVRSRTLNDLPIKWKTWSLPVAQTILSESKRYGMDPLFIMAIITNESRFNPQALGTRGEIGLMQIKPDTAAWISAKLKLKFTGKKMLYQPLSNIKIGTAYLAYLREQFSSKSTLYLSAYNMGPRRVQQFMKRSSWSKEYARRTLKHYLKFYRELSHSTLEG